MSDTKAVEQRIGEIRAKWDLDAGAVDYKTGETMDDIWFLLDHLDSIPSQIEAAVQAEREAWSDVRRIGAQLSNIAYNLSHAGKDRVVTEYERKVLAACASECDAAIRARGEANRG